jgi:hypothetical protein
MVNFWYFGRRPRTDGKCSGILLTATGINEKFEKLNGYQFLTIKKSSKMKDFLLVYRTDYSTIPKGASPEQMQASAKRWMDWIGGIAAQNKLIDRGNRLVPSGKVVKADNVIADGPYTEIKECIVGYSIVKAASMEEAAELTTGCPILAIGGNVEVREINAL